MQSIGLVAQDELVLATVDGQLAEGKLLAQPGGQLLNLGTCLLCGSAFSGNQNMLVGARHELDLTGLGFLGGGWLDQVS